MLPIKLAIVLPQMHSQMHQTNQLPLPHNQLQLLPLPLKNRPKLAIRKLSLKQNHVIADQSHWLLRLQLLLHQPFALHQSTRHHDQSSTQTHWPIRRRRTHTHHHLATRMLLHHHMRQHTRTVLTHHHSTVLPFTVRTITHTHQHHHSTTEISHSENRDDNQFDSNATLTSHND